MENKMKIDTVGLRALRDRANENDRLYQWSEIALDCIQQFEDRILSWSDEADEEIKILKTRIEELEGILLKIHFESSLVITKHDSPPEESYDDLKKKVEELEEIKKKYLLLDSRLTHCDKCACTWIDDGLNPVSCPYCNICGIQ